MTGDLLKKTLAAIEAPDEAAMAEAANRWRNKAKPLNSMGRLEKVVIQLAGIQKTADVKIDKKGLVIMCADNGIVEEGVTQSGQDVTATVAENFLDCRSCVAVMCRECGADVRPIDIGMAVDTPRVEKHKVAYGTKNLAKEPAMSREEAIKALEIGISLAMDMKEKGYDIIATGEMGIGNTSTSSALTAVFLDCPVEDVTGRGAGLSGEGLVRKINAIKRGIAVNKPDPTDPIDVLAKMGGFDIAGMAGLFLGCAACHMPCVVDGFVSGAAALTALRICPEVTHYMLASHVSAEPAGRMILDALGKQPFITCDMCVGEGTGAVALFPLLNMGLAVYRDMISFAQTEIGYYVPLK
ncbi:MAG: nicotinate-nucleotide--dimethylbenzimidazole phosphoribosyltransferase [Lachnospiraceae bacterium]|nr:nicotinate-nucleotide--dimethylbenzimidazole phosphoribosyltransferase [Lachnospiraceae bacterium]